MRWTRHQSQARETWFRLGREVKEDSGEEVRLLWPELLLSGEAAKVEYMLDRFTDLRAKRFIVVYRFPFSFCAFCFCSCRMGDPHRWRTKEAEGMLKLCQRENHQPNPKREPA
jgi:hypothetical protein